MEKPIIVVKILSRPSTIPLIIANILPLLGVIFLDWDLFQILFLYWLECGVIGFYNIFKLIKVSGLLSILLVPFFIVHYGGFMAGHLIFIFAFFAPDLASSSFFPPRETITSLLGTVAIPLATLFISHGISFFHNFIGKGEYKRTDAGKQMQEPYRRVVLMHVTLIFGGWIVLLLNTPVFALALLVILKTIADLHSHVNEHPS